MRNNIYKFLITICFYLNFISSSYSNEDFIFQISEIDIKENGNLIIGSNGGKAITTDGFEVIGEKFNYNKLTNILTVFNNVKLISKKDQIIILSDKATYLKNDEIIFTEGNSKAFNDEFTLDASKFKFNKNKNILNAEENVKFLDTKDDTTILSDKATYLKNDEVIFTEGSTKGLIQNKYNFNSKDIAYSKIDGYLNSKSKSTIEDDEGNSYELDSFFYEIDNKILKGKNINVFSKVDENKTDKYFFSDGFFNFLKNSFVSKDTKIKLHKDIFDNEEQDPRIYGTSSRGDDKKTIITNGVFTSCNINNDCPAWSMEAEKITHDKINKDMIYKNAVLKIYDIPILYFPKFFHPDPTVDRRTGFLRPQLNSSNTLGSSIFVPYFVALDDDKDFTFKPTIFEDKVILQNEYRKVTENSSLISDFSLTKGYVSSNDNKEKNITHFFLNYDQDLKLNSFEESILNLQIEKVSNDTYLKVFQNNLFETPAMPSSKDVMKTEVELSLIHDDYDFSAELNIFENLGKKNNDRYEYVLPSYSFSKNLKFNNFDGSINFFSNGSNNLKNTNNLRTSITNDIEIKSRDYFTNNGFKNNFNIYFKNLNSIGKDDPTYKSSPRLEAMNIVEFSSSYPLTKSNSLQNEILTPRISFRANPGNNMKNYSSTERTINSNNIFDINRLGITDSFEAGRSLTLGLDYKIDKIEKIEQLENDALNSNQPEKLPPKDKYINFRLATVLRDKTETEIPTSSTIDKKSSNIFGQINNQLFENVDLNYYFSINNNLDTFNSHQLNSEFKVNNFITEFNYIEQNGDIGSSHSISNKTSYELDENNSFAFTTRRNKKINLTEYYDLSYQYKNDCLIAGIKYNKTFYQDNDIKPQENLFFTITLVPLTTYERIVYEN